MILEVGDRISRRQGNSVQKAMQSSGACKDTRPFYHYRWWKRPHEMKNGQKRIGVLTASLSHGTPDEESRRLTSLRVDFANIHDSGQGVDLSTEI